MNGRSPRIAVAVLALAAWFQAGYTWYRLPDRTPLRWYCDEVPVFWDQALCADVPPGDAEAAIRASLRAWNDIPCPHPVLVEGGGVQGVPPFQGDPPRQAGNNVVLFEDAEAWGVGEGKVPGVIALTTILYDTRTGALGSFALEVNDGDFRFGTTGAPREMDLQNTLTHEFGHVLALDHSTEGCQRPDAPTMCFSAPSGEVAKRSLEQDDRDGICALYRQRWNEEGSCRDPDPGSSSGGCGMTSRPVGPWAALLAVALAWFRRRRPGPGRPNGDSLARRP